MTYLTKLILFGILCLLLAGCNECSSCPECPGGVWNPRIEDFRVDVECPEGYWCIGVPPDANVITSVEYGWIATHDQEGNDYE